MKGGQWSLGLRGAEKKAPTISGAVEDACIGAGVGDLLESFGDRFVACSIEFVFPTDEFCFWKPAAKLGENFCRGRKCEG